MTIDLYENQMIFWVFIGLLSVAAMVAVLAPLFRQRPANEDGISGEQALYEARIKEIEKDLEIGRLNAQEATAARTEVARKLIKAESEQGEISTGRSKFSTISLITSAFFVPIFTLAIYLPLGNPPLQTASPGDSEPASIETLLEAAERRLSANPDDARGWKVIAPVYARLGQYDKSIEAHRKVIRLEGRKAETLFGLGEVLMAKSGGQVTPEALELFKETVGLAPENAVANFYIGVHAMQNGDNEGAIDIWQAMVDGAKGSEDWLPTVRERIAELKKSPDTTPTDQSPEDQSEMIAGMVSRLEERLKENPDDKEGWEMLVRSYIVLDRIDDAKTAYIEATSHFPKDGEFKRKLGQYHLELTSRGEQQ